MTRTGTIAIWILVGMTIVGAVHYYLWARLVRDVGLSQPMHRVATAVMVLLCLSVPLTFYLGRTQSGALRKLLLMPSYVWMGSLFFLFVGLLAFEVVRFGGGLLQRLAAAAPEPDPSRRLLLARLVAVALFFVTGTASAASVRSALGRVAVKDVRVRLARLPRELDGTVIVQLSDVHVGPTIGRQFVEDIVEQVNALSADVVVITGDLVDGSVPQLRELVAPLGNLKAKHGVFFVTGNHEYYSGARAWCAELERLGIRVLRNERVEIGTTGASFDLAGVDDYSAHQFGHGHGANLERAVEGRDPSRELVLLAHQPRQVYEAVRHGVGLQLSGHTHGGQLWPWNYLVKLQQPVVSGLERFGATQVYVSNGTGYWGPPMRLGAPAEITKIVLESGTS
jgi:predicted MPP superfamily phosphohydrolase